MKKGFDIIGAPFNQLGCVTTEQNTVDGLRDMDERSWVGLTDWIQVRTQRWGSDIVDVGDVVVTSDVKNLIQNGHKDKALFNYANDVKSTLLASYQNNRIPITIGGDHSIAVGTLQATMEFYQKEKGKKVAVVWVDAHADINNSLDSNLHGKPLALLTNQYPHNDWNIPSDSAVNPKDIYYIGVRDVMRNEFDLINELNMTNYDMSFIEKHGFNAVVDVLMAKLEQDYDHIYLSFDYDALDGSIFRACATPNVGGLTAREALHLVHTLSSSPKFVGADFVEYMPELDNNGMSKEFMVKLIDAVWGFRS
ncbi:arginase family protein [Photobacterium japonica]|uniref:arginase family protein n=1 Tax=Photobacterium japonica TaxID=2910235 RepID=UPI003D0D8651